MPDDPVSTSRRKLMQGATAGLVTAVAARAVAQTDVTNSTGTAEASPLQDPRALYPHPPFPAQQQPWPGLAGRMNPRPDHGETSYRGTGRLNGRRALITGGDSGIGRAAAIAYAREGADVAIVYLPAEEPDAREVVQIIRAAGRKAVPLPGDIRDEAFCKSLVEQAVSGLGGLDILVSNAGRQQSKIRFSTSPRISSTGRYALTCTRCSGLPRQRYRTCRLVRRSSLPVRSMHSIRPPTCWITP